MDKKDSDKSMSRKRRNTRETAKHNKQEQPTEKKHRESKSRNVILKQNIYDTIPMTNNGSDCFLIAAVNGINNMINLKNSIIQYSTNEECNDTQIQLAQILSGDHNLIKRLRQTMGSYDDEDQHDSSTALYHLFDSVDAASKELIEFNMQISQSCSCNTINYDGSNIQSIELQIGWFSQIDNIPFGMLLERWIRHEGARCDRCKNDRIIQNDVIIPPQQKYLVMEINRFTVADGGKSVIEHKNRITHLNANGQEFFENNWKLIGATEYKGHVRNGHYLYWKNAQNQWIIVDDDNVKVSKALNEGYRGYRYFIFEKQ